MRLHNDTSDLPGDQDDAFDPVRILSALDGFELHGVTRWDERGRTCLALSRGREYALAMVDDSGSADTAFGAGGIVRDCYGSNVGNGITPGRRVAVLDGSLIVGGMTEYAPGRYSPALACYDAQGQRVEAFNGSGQVVLAELLAAAKCKMGAVCFETNLSLCSTTGIAVDTRFAPQPKQAQDFNQVNFDMRVADDRIYVVATARIGDQPRLSGLVFCITAEGQLDVLFGDQGVAALRSDTYSVLLRSIALHDDGIYVAGGAAGGSNPALAARIDYAGQHDELFGTVGEGGYAITREAFRINDLVVDDEGTLFGVGVGVGSSVRAIAVSFNADGVQNEQFAGNGAYIPGLDYSSFTYAGIDNEARLVFIGDYLDRRSGYLRTMVTRLLPDGSLDTAFGAQGMANLDIMDAIGASMIVQPDGKLIAVGYTDRAVNAYAIRLFA